MSSHPSHLPSAVKTYLDRHEIKVSHLSTDLGFADNFISKLFKSEQAHLQSYCRIADAGGISLQTLVDKIKNKQMAAYIDLLVSRLDVENEKDRHRTGLAKRIGVSEALLRTLYKDEGRLNGIHSHVVIAEKIGVPIDALRKPSAFERISA